MLNTLVYPTRWKHDFLFEILALCTAAKSSRVASDYLNVPRETLDLSAFQSQSQRPAVGLVAAALLRVNPRQLPPPYAPSALHGRLLTRT